MSQRSRLRHLAILDPRAFDIIYLYDPVKRKIRRDRHKKQLAERIAFRKLMRRKYQR